MPLVHITSKAILAGLNDSQKEFVTKSLTFENPQYSQLKRLQKFYFNKDQYLTFYEINSAGSLVVPIGFLPKFFDVVHIDSSDIFDQRVTRSDLPDIEFKGELRDYQQNMVDAILPRTVGTIEAPTGSGKSVVIVNIIVERKQNTLILVNTLELMNQMVDNLVKFSSLKKEDVGIIGNGKWEPKPVSVCTLQTLARLNDTFYDLLNQFYGHIIFDECHLAPAETFYNVMTRLSAKYKFGFSATPQRDDGLDDVIFFACGPKIHKVELSEIKDNLVIPTVRRVNTDFYFPLFSSDEYNILVDTLCKDDDRNKLIADTMDEYKGQQAVILTTRVAHVMRLVKELTDRGYNARYLVSGIPKPNGKKKMMPKKERKEVIDGLQSGDIDVVVSTYSLFSTGIDVSGLEILMLAGPTRSEVKIKQSIGRIMRKAKHNKNPEIVDFRDVRVDLLKYQGYARNRVYKYLEIK